MDIHNRSNGETVRKEDAFKTRIYREFAEETELYSRVLDNIESILVSLHDFPRWRDKFSSGIGFDGCSGSPVILSDKRKKYLEVFIDRHLLPENENDRDKDFVKVLGSIRVLGEYNDGNIILYVNNIMDIAEEKNVPNGVCGIPYLTLLRYVYLHELMHAYFDRKENEGHEYNYEAEEGFAEFGALLLLKELVTHNLCDDEPLVNHATMEELEWAIRHVESKTGVLKCYARGAELFKQYGADKELCKQMLHEFPKELEKVLYFRYIKKSL